MKRLLLTFAASASLFAGAAVSAFSAGTGTPWVRNTTDACVFVTVEGDKGSYTGLVGSRGDRQFREIEHPTKIRFEFNDPYIAGRCKRGLYVQTIDEDVAETKTTFTVFELTGRNKNYAVHIYGEN